MISVIIVHINSCSLLRGCITWLLLLTTLHSPNPGLAQSKLGIKDSPKASQFVAKGNELVKSKKYDRAIMAYQRAAIIYKESGSWNSFFFCQFQVGYYLNVQQKYEESITYLDSIELNFVQNLSVKYPSFQRFYGVKSWAHFKLIQLERALYYFSILEESAKENEEVHPDDLLYAVYYKGVVYQRVGQYNLALEQMNSAKGLCDNLGASDYSGKIYNNLGIIYRNLGEYKRSSEFYEKALAILKKTESEVSLTPIYNNLGNVYLYQEQYETALGELNFAIKALANYTTDYYQVESALINTKSNVLIKLRRFKEAQEILDSVLAREIKKYGKKNYVSSATLCTLGRLYSEKREYKKSNEYLKLSIEITQSYLGIKNDKSAETNNLIGNNQIREGNFRQAVETFQQSIISLVTEFNEVDISKNPTLTETILDRVELVEALYRKAEALLALHLQNKSNKYLIAATDANKTATRLVEQVRNHMLYESSIISLSKKAKSIYEQSINIKLLSSNDERLRNGILAAIENSKAYTLAYAVQQAKSLGYSAQPDSALLKEANLKTSIKILESELRSASLSGKDSVSVNKINEALFAAKEEFEKYERMVLKKTNTLSNILVPSLNTVQEQLESNDLLVDYFAGDSTLYAIAISKSNTNVYVLGTYKYIVNLLREGVSQNIRVEEFQQIAFRAYNLLLEPVLLENHKFKRLIIVPDQQLGTIPFDALISSLNDAPSYKNLNYLLNDYTVFQHQSAGLYIAGNSVYEHNLQGYIGFAPDFNSKELKELGDRKLRSNLQPLPFARKEVEAISTLLKGTIETGNEANEEKFKSLAGNFNILHIASHAIIDDENPLYSKLIFATGDSTQQEDGNLYSFEIYELKLESDLVTLSACNTGNGRFYEGEGIFSLGRAFLVAGVKSVLTSLWEVSDQSTSQIITSFYKHLKEGANKPEALRQAKLDYLKNADELTANPYYWAGFVYTGKPEPVYKSNKFYYWLGGVLLLLFIGSVFLRRRKQTTTY